jgi:hypothetical protein
MSEWARCVLSLPLLPQPVPPDERDLEAAKRQALKAIVPVVVAPRRWFFRRYALDGEDPHGDDCRAFRLYVEMGQHDTYPGLEQRLAAAAAPLVQVLCVREWNASFGRGYGGPAGWAAMRDFCCEAAPVAILEERDPVCIAQRYIALRPEAEENMRHWWVWLRNGPLCQDEDRLWQAALDAHRAGTPPPGWP